MFIYLAVTTTIRTLKNATSERDVMAILYNSELLEKGDSVDTWNFAMGGDFGNSATAVDPRPRVGAAPPARPRMG